MKLTDEQERKLPMLYRLSGVKRRNSTLLEKPDGEPRRQSFFPHARDEHDRGPGIGARMERYEADAPGLAVGASRKAVEAAGADPGSLTHLVTVSCSGFAAPNFDIAIMKRLGLAPTVQRVHVGFMGCHGALNGLRVAKGLVESDPAARVLLCAVEVCSIHYYFGWDPEKIVANALFADGAAAMVLGADSNQPPWRMAASGCVLIPDSEDAMTWRIRDHGFEMTLAPTVPKLIGDHLKPWMEAWLGEHGVRIEDVASWAVHPGGPRILGSVTSALGLERDSVALSRETLGHCGNMSSPTVVFILEQMRERGYGLPCVALGFGPGLMAEAALFV
jgi:predicted naringenin-chalcone synthase